MPKSKDKMEIFVKTSLLGVLYVGAKDLQIH
jgi:hypothetical protein